MSTVAGGFFLHRHGYGFTWMACTGGQYGQKAKRHKRTRKPATYCAFYPVWPVHFLLLPHLFAALAGCHAADPSFA
jgi:hypothetical protein